ncbi:unnamed protein product [Choristocarpus tenellus]
MGKSINTRMRDLGGIPFLEAAYADEATGMEATVEPWLTDLYPKLESLLSQTPVTNKEDGREEETKKTNSEGGVCGEVDKQDTGTGGSVRVRVRDGNGAGVAQERLGDEKGLVGPEGVLSGVDKAEVSKELPVLVLSSSESAPAQLSTAETGLVGSVGALDVKGESSLQVAAQPVTKIESPSKAISEENKKKDGGAHSNGDITKSEYAPPVPAQRSTWSPSNSHSGVLPPSNFLQPEQLDPTFLPPPGDVPRARAPAPDVRFCNDAESRVRVRSGSGAGGGGDEGWLMMSRPRQLSRSGSVDVSAYSSDCPFEAPVMRARYLTKGGRAAERRVILMELCLRGSGLSYEPGDVIGIKCPNRKEEVDYVLNRLQENLPAGDGPDSLFVHSIRSLPSPCTLRGALSTRLDLQTPLRRPVLRTLAEACTDENEKRLMKLLSSKKAGEKFYEGFVTSQALSLPELLEAFPSCKPRAGALLALLPPLPPRYYSVASSQLKTVDHLAIAFSVVTHHLNTSNKHSQGVSGVAKGLNDNSSGIVVRPGLCTHWLEGILGEFLDEAEGGVLHNGSLGASKSGVLVPLFMKPTKEFLLPASAKWPCVLIGPGTGVSPFIGFLHHREQQMIRRKEVKDAVCSGYWRGGYEIHLEGEEDVASSYMHSEGRGEIVLFFGCRSSESDWIFQSEMEGFMERGVLSKLNTAFSRDKPVKVYVQDRIRDQGKDLCSLMLDRGAYIYVCGDGNAMAQGVHQSLVEILSNHRSLSPEESELILKDMKERKRYVLDVWS